MARTYGIYGVNGIPNGEYSVEEKEEYFHARYRDAVVESSVICARYSKTGRRDWLVVELDEPDKGRCIWKHPEQTQDYYEALSLYHARLQQKYREFIGKCSDIWTHTFYWQPNKVESIARKDGNEE